MDIPKIIKEHHQAMIDKGFYDCPECHDTFGGCETCQGSGLDENKNSGELIAMIVGELLGEALNAHRSKNFGTLSEHYSSIDLLLYEMSCNSESINKFAIWIFKENVKDSYYDEIADTFLRMFDFCGYTGIVIKPDYGEFYYHGWTNVGSDFLMISQQIISKDFTFAFNLLHGFCRFHKIDIEKHILAKMAYNKTRPYKHNKEY